MKYIDITAFILGICPPQRLLWLKQSVDHLDKQHFPFVKKIIAVDEYRGYTMPDELKKYFESKGWIVLVDAHMSRVKSMDHAFSLIDSEYLFYNEDDVLAPMPRIEDLTRIFSYATIKKRECGMISLTMGGSHSHFPENKYGDLNQVSENILLENEDYLVFRRLEKEKNDWFFEFPALFIRTDLFKLCHETAKRKYSGLQVEMGLTKAWFKQKVHKKYYKCSIGKKDILGIVCDNPVDVYYKAFLLTLLDPKQGYSPFGGNHGY
jgi:hypothetical protein